MEKLSDEELIAKFMGLSHKTIVTVYNYGFDFRHSYDEQVIYSNEKPNLVRYEEKFVTQILNVYDNFFDSDNQGDDFEYEMYLNYNDWNKLMPVIEKCYGVDCNNDFKVFDEEDMIQLMNANLSWMQSKVVTFLNKYYESNIKV